MGIPWCLGAKIATSWLLGGRAANEAGREPRADDINPTSSFMLQGRTCLQIAGRKF